jgi:hypothetical protein
MMCRDDRGRMLVTGRAGRRIWVGWLARIWLVWVCRIVLYRCSIAHVYIRVCIHIYVCIYMRYSIPSME